MKPGKRAFVGLAAISAVLLPVLLTMALAGAGLALLDPGAAQASHNEITCDGVAGRTKSVAAFAHGTNATFNFPADGVGHFDPTPLLLTTLTTTQSGCVVANFSAMAQPTDNHVMFQVRIDGVPMIGHMSGVAGTTTPAVFDPEETNLNNPRMVAANFFARVAPGEHRVEVLWAACCSGVEGGSGAAAPSAVLVLHYR